MLAAVREVRAVLGAVDLRALAQESEHQVGTELHHLGISLEPGAAAKRPLGGMALYLAAETECCRVSHRVRAGRARTVDDDNASGSEPALAAGFGYGLLKLVLKGGLVSP